ncbi:hypothetical protein JHK84_030262 [Glycine max]|nr:hypothetical protein JHK84_030262 [Glycine max]
MQSIENSGITTIHFLDYESENTNNVCVGSSWTERHEFFTHPLMDIYTNAHWHTAKLDNWEQFSN